MTDQESAEIVARARESVSNAFVAIQMMTRTPVEAMVVCCMILGFMVHDGLLSDDEEQALKTIHTMIDHLVQNGKSPA